MPALADGPEALDGVLELDVYARRAGENLGDVEGLGEETLHLPGARHRQLVFLGELVHAQDGDDVLEVLVALEDRLHLPRNLVVLVAHHPRVQDPRRGVEGIHRRVDAQLRDLPRKHRGGIEMGEGGGRRRVGQVVGGHVDGLHRGDGALARGGDALLQLAQVGGQRGLVSDGGGHAAQQRGDLGVGLGETEDVVDEEQDVPALLVTEVLGHGQGRQRHPGTGARRLVHLAVDQRGLVEDAGFLHLQVEVVSFAGAFADAAEHGVAAVLHGQVVDELHEDDGLAHAGAAEEADLPAAGVGRQQVHHLDAGLERLDLGLLVDERRRLAVDRVVLLGFHRRTLVHGLADHVQDAPQGLVAHGHADAGAGVHGVHAADEPLGGVHGDAADGVLAQVLRHLHHQVPLPVVDGLVGDLDGVVDRRQVPVGKLNVDHRAQDLSNLPHLHSVFVLPKIRQPSASAVETTSSSSLVMAACRARFICSVRALMRSEALLVADSMAVIRAPCSPALASRSAW